MKNFNKLWVLTFPGNFKFDLKMRLTTLFLFVTLFQLQANDSYGQRERVTLDLDNVTIERVFDRIEAQTPYKFFVNVSDINLSRRVSVKAKNKRVSTVLDDIFGNTNITYALIGEQIVLSRERIIQNNTSNTEISAQDKVTVTGTVKDADGNPIAGATVVYGEYNKQGFYNVGVVTDFDGNYSLTYTPKSGEVQKITAYFLGYKTVTEDVGGRTSIDFVLQEDVSNLEEVLVVGYGTTKKKDLTGSVGSVKSEQIQQIKSQTIDQALVGKVTGVYVNAQSGAPGSGALVNIRGLSQLIGDNQPLYVVDGVPIVINPIFSDVGSIGTFGDRENPLLTINPADIERVDVLKDASSAAIYGSRAANGVVLITTKRGKRNTKTRFNFSYNTTVQNPLNTYDVLNASEWQQFITDQGLAGSVTFGDADTDWQDEITNKNAIWNQYDFNVSGGTEKVNYLVSARVTDQKGLLIGNKFNRYNFSANLDANVSDRLLVGSNISYNYSNNRQSGIGSLASGAFFRPDLGVFNDDGTYTTAPGTFNFTLRNPVGGDGKIKNRAISQNILGSVYGQYEIIEGLNFRSQLSINLNNDRSSIFSPSFTLNALFGQFFGTTGALLDVQHTRGVSSSWSNTLNYNKTIAEDHTIDAVAGVSWDYSRLDLEGQEYSEFPDDEILININSASNFVSASSDATQTALNSLFGRINYSYKDRYLATFTARYDGSIKFGPDNQRGFFPSAALAWNVHNEPFLADNKLISQLKLRASLGRTGSDNLPAFTFVSSYASLGNNDSFYDGTNGIVVEGVPNSAIRWEETDQLDLGLEFGLFNGRLNGELVYFEKKTSDIILLVPIPGQTGSTSWNANIADVTNKGWELAIGGDIIRNNDLRWNSSFNISWVNNNVDALNGGATSAFGSAGIIEGEPIGVHLGYEVVSIAQTQDEIDALNVGAPDGNYFNALTQPGDYIFKDLDGDGEITADDRKPLGSINPKFFGGWNNTISYKNFDFTFNFNFVDGNQKYWREGGAALGLPVNPNVNVLRTVVDDTWTPENTNAKYARIGSGTHGVNTPNTKTVFEGSYIKLRSASIGYNFPREWLDNTGIDNVQIKITGNNLFVISDYPGIDPESVPTQRGGATVDLRADQGFSYPQARTFTFGVNIGL